MQKLVFATNNKNKLEEIKAILKDKYKIIGLKELGFYGDIAETGHTLSENAYIKSSFVYDKYELNVFSDDTGLEIEALDNKPGVYSARYAGEDGNSEANIQKVLKEMDGITNRNARFRTIISLIMNGKEFQFEGEVKGKIDTQKQGDAGFGYDPIFIPEGYQLSFAQISAEEKNKISHRGRAMEKLITFLKNN